jgi:hypothetical protein
MFMCLILYTVLGAVVVHQAFLLKELAIEVKKLAQEVYELRS